MGKESELTFGQKVSLQWNSFRKFLWNSEEKTVLGRNGKSWGQIGLFYLVFYACLALFWAIMLIVFLQTISDEKPKFTSYIGTPGLYQIPQPDEKVNIIKYDMGNEETWLPYTKQMKKTYNQYVNDFENNNYTDCQGTGVRNLPEDRDEICQFDIEEAFSGVCVPPHFGYDLGKPCIIVGLNRVWGWEPENYAADDIPSPVKNTHQMDFITVACEVYKAPQAGLNSTMIFPEPGFSFKYYPYMGAVNDDYKDRYVSPLIAIQFDLQKKNEQVRLVCKSYADNIQPGTGLFDTSYASELRLDLTITKKES